MFAIFNVILDENFSFLPALLLILELKANAIE